MNKYKNENSDYSYKIFVSCGIVSGLIILGAFAAEMLGVLK